MMSNFSVICYANVFSPPIEDIRLGTFEALCVPYVLFLWNSLVNIDLVKTEILN